MSPRRDVKWDKLPYVGFTLHSILSHRLEVVGLFRLFHNLFSFLVRVLSPSTVIASRLFSSERSRVSFCLITLDLALHFGSR